MPPLVGNPRATNPRWTVAEHVADALRRRFGMRIQAIGVHGSLAHGDDTDASDVDLVVVTRQTGSGAGGTGLTRGLAPVAGPQPGTRRIDGVIVDLGVIGADEYLRHARTLTTSWPLAADQYITTKALHDPDGWWPRLRDAHLAFLAKVQAAEFASLAREAWCRAKSAHLKARRLAEWYETDAAMLVLAEARLGVAMVDGLLTRTYFRNSADAVRRAGVAASDLPELGSRLIAQADELPRRGRPVDGDIGDLLG